MDTNILRENLPNVPAEEETPHSCYEGFVYIGYMLEDENGEEVESSRLCLAGGAMVAYAKHPKPFQLRAS